MQDIDLTEAVRALLVREAITQAELGRRAGVSQSTISRAASRRALRQGVARARLFIYMRQQALRAVDSAGTRQVLTAFERVWDGSEAHAAALAKILTATEDLRPLT